MQNTKRIGVITLPFSPNYGWLLQTYAMQQILKKLGYDPILIYRKWDLTKNNSGLINALKRWIYYNFLCRKLYSFFRKKINKTKIYRNNYELKAVVNEYKLDAVIVGSDQVWRFENTRGVGYNFFLDFVEKDSIHKIAYAASFGVDYWTGTEKELNYVKVLLHHFKAVSVRETSGVKLCTNLFNIKPSLVLDPTLLLDSSDYEKLINKHTLNTDTNILSTYILDPSNEKDKLIESIALRKNLQVKSLYIDKRKGSIHTYNSLQYWLANIRNAKYVIVDSFHGLVFCIIFKKNFLVISNKRRGTTRFESLLTMLNLNNRLIHDLSDLDYDVVDNDINYGDIEIILNKQRESSIKFLTTNIE